MEIKTFKDVIKEVHEKGICQQCGGCVSFCNSIEDEVIGYKEPNTPPVFINEDKCLECGICYLICPQTHVLDEEINKVYSFSDFSSMPLGSFKDIFSCQTNDEEFLKYGTDGGVVNTLIHYLLEEKVIDGAIVAKTDAPFSRAAVIARSKEDLIKASGLKLDLSTQLDGVHKFHTYTSSLPKLKSYKFNKLAVVGTPCQIYTIRCMQSLGIIPSQNIELCLGLFCYENFFFDNVKIKQFEKDFKLKFSNVAKINIKEDLIVKLKNNSAEGKTLHIPFEDLEDYMRPACKSCDDFTNIYADISFGGLGSPDKFTTVITRTEKGKKIISKALESGKIKNLELVPSNKNEMIKIITQFSHSKMKRKEQFFEKKLIKDVKK